MQTNPNTARRLVFTEPGRNTVETVALNTVEDAVCCRSLLSGISAGSELLAFRGRMPQNDSGETLQALQGAFEYPCAYGYINVAEVTASQLQSLPVGSRVFAFHPHQDRFWIQPDQCLLLPPELSVDNAVFTASMETAVGIVHDCDIALGDDVLVQGQGIIGLFTAWLLLKNGAGSVVTVEPDPHRSAVSASIGCTAVSPQQLSRLSGSSASFDVVVDTACSPQALAESFSFCRMEGKVVVGSWYGASSPSLPLGGYFHRRRLQLISSQVSHVRAALHPRWDKQRRFELVFELLKQLNPSQFITHRFPYTQSQQAYELLNHPKRANQAVLQVVFDPQL